MTNMIESLRTHLWGLLKMIALLNENNRDGRTRGFVFYRLVRYHVSNRTSENGENGEKQGGCRQI